MIEMIMYSVCRCMPGKDKFHSYSHIHSRYILLTHAHNRITTLELKPGEFGGTTLFYYYGSRATQKLVSPPIRHIAVMKKNLYRGQVRGWDW